MHGLCGVVRYETSGVPLTQAIPHNDRPGGSKIALVQFISTSTQCEC